LFGKNFVFGYNPSMDLNKEQKQAVEF